MTKATMLSCRLDKNASISRVTSIRERRERLSLTQAEVARAVGVSRQAYVAIESKSATPRVDVALKVASVLGCSVEELFLEPGRQKAVATASVAKRLMVVDIAGERRYVEVGVELGDLSACADAMGVVKDGEIREVMSTGWDSVLFSGCDPVLGLLSSYLEDTTTKTHHRWMNRTNTEALSCLLSHEAHFAVMHHSCTKDFTFEGLSELPLSEWELVLAFRPGYRGGRSLEDLVGTSVVFAGRPKGSGVFDFLSMHPSLDGCEPSGVFGRYLSLKDHEQVASALSLSLADVGVTSLAAAKARTLEFTTIDLQKSRLLYDPKAVDPSLVEKVGETVSSRRFRLELTALSGYR
ncbi:transcriptional regulator of molybdate metabolism, XRE family [Ferrithrix thermotolerans DSM 19514]|uniref:Transcriptional regulator of molybdate metabolism, XRE family n=1 Tax=Ferrithrix thermotolerans DSM 19514 TaxID=1121881 RepID=A0A1M4S5U9_9ACTN|nr:transcriptional regulator of molybdate metabolism, XRE family [Ferrithrix thermotolerans DSM 19514]